jgi:hypothetical protein
MSDIIIYRKLDSDTLHLPELRALIGKTIEIVVRERLPLPADVPERWRALWDIGGEDLIDAEAVRRLRDVSRMNAEPKAGG